MFLPSVPFTRSRYSCINLRKNHEKSIVPEEFQHYFDDWHFSPVIEADGTVYLSGVTAARKDKPISQHPEEQFHDAFYKLGVYLKAAGLGMKIFLR